MNKSGYACLAFAAFLVLFGGIFGYALYEKQWELAFETALVVPIALSWAAGY